MGIYDNLNLLPPDLFGFNMYKSKIFDNLIREVSPKVIIEVGTWKGGSAFTMCESIKSNGLNTKLYCVDTWLGALEFIDEKSTWMSTESLRKERDLMNINGYPNVYYQFLSNVVHTENQNIITPIPNTSLISARYFSNNDIRAELIFIDGSHDYEDVLLDLNAYSKLISGSGGILFGDDYNEKFGVKKAVDEFCSNNNLKFEVLENNFWIIRYV